MNRNERERLAIIETKLDNIEKGIQEIKGHYEHEEERLEKVERLVIQNDQILKNHLSDVDWSRKKVVAFITLVSGSLGFLLNQIYELFLRRG